MAILVTSTPVSVPTGVRITSGKINYNTASYTVGGDSITVAQWGGNANGIPNRFPDFVIFNGGTASDDGDGDAATVFKYVAGGKVQVYGEESLSADVGLLEQDNEASSATALFLAIWLTPDPAGQAIQ